MPSAPAPASVSGASPGRAVLVGAVTGLSVVVVMIAALLAKTAEPSPIADPGVLVRWGLPMLDAVSVIALSLTVGLLLAATFFLPDRQRTPRRARALGLAAHAASVWAVSAVLVLLFSFADIAGTPLTSGDFVSQFVSFALTVEITRVLAIHAGLAVIVTTLLYASRARVAGAWALALALLAVTVLALTGHAAGSASHEDAVNSLAVHLLGVTLWFGGLLGLVVVRRGLGQDLAAVVRRYSAVALWCFVAVGLSGLMQSWIRLGSLSGLGSTYGVLILLKVAAFVVLGWCGWAQRRNIVARLSTDPSDGRAFARLALLEVGVMAFATGIAVTLSRGIPPVPDAAVAPSRVQDLTGYRDPGPMTSADWFTAWRIDWLFVAIAITAVGVYWAWVARLRGRGDHWPVLRAVAWSAGWVLFVWATCGAPGIWGRVTFSTHMVMHMIVAMIVPLLLVPGAPITLALRAIAPRTDKTWGPREFLLQLVHSRILQVFANPIVAAVLFFVSLAIFYFSPLFELALTTHTGHILMMAHFLITGYVFAWVLVGIDPGPKKWPPLMLLVILFVTVSFHAFFGVILTGMTDLLAPDFFNALQLPWLTDPKADQVTAGQIAWGVGELPTLILAIMVGRQWFQSDRAESARKDRQADRDGDAELKAYNAYLAARRSGGSGGSGGGTAQSAPAASSADAERS